MSVERAAEKSLTVFEAEWVPCVGCGTRVPLVTDSADTSEPHRSRCLGLRLPPGASDGTAT